MAPTCVRKVACTYTLPVVSASVTTEGVSVQPCTDRRRMRQKKILQKLGGDTPFLFADVEAIEGFQVHGPFRKGVQVLSFQQRAAPQNRRPPFLTLNTGAGFCNFKKNPFKLTLKTLAIVYGKWEISQDTQREQSPLFWLYKTFNHK